MSACLLSAGGDFFGGGSGSATVVVRAAVAPAVLCWVGDDCTVFEPLFREYTVPAVARPMTRTTITTIPRMCPLPDGPFSNAAVPCLTQGSPGGTIGSKSEPPHGGPGAL